jgi:hypothetical protein
MDEIFISSDFLLMIPFLRITRLLVTPCSMLRNLSHSRIAKIKVRPSVGIAKIIQITIGTFENQWSLKSPRTCSPFDNESWMYPICSSFREF